MKRILQRKFMLVFWLATILMGNLTAIAQTSVIDGGSGWTNPIGEVTAVSYDQATNYTTYEIRCIRGFGIKSFTIDNTLNSLTRTSEDDDYSYYTCSNLGNETTSSHVYTADFFIEPITESVELCNIFNYYSDNSSEQSNNEVIVSLDVQGSKGSSAHPLVVDFQNTNPIIIHIKEDKKISGFNIEVNNGNVTFAVKEGSTTNYQNDITLNNGNLTLQGQVVGIRNLDMQGGTLTINGEDGERANVANLNASGGVINIKNIHTNGGISNLNLSGDVTITGENQFTNETGAYDCNNIEGFLYNKATVTKGKVLLKTVPINPRSLFEVQGGDVTFEKVTFGSVNFWNGNISGTADIQVKGGTVILDNCHFEKRDVNANTDLDYVVEVEAGSLTIKDGVYKAGIKAFLHTTGTGVVSVENGLFDAAYNYSTTTDQRNYLMELNGGKVTINNGIFRGTCSCVESGALEVNGGSYRYSTYSNIKDASFYIKDNAADVKIQGGEFSTASIYFESGVTKSISDLLPTDYHFYKEYNGYFAEEVTDFKRGEEYNLPGKILEFASVSNVLGSTNRLLDDAKTADVGPNGKDVKVVQSRLNPRSRKDQYLYTYEINTPIGLAWYAAVQNIPESMPYVDDYPLDAGDFGEDLPSLLKEGKPSVVLTADLNMEGYDWVPFPIRYGMLFDGKGHVISNLTVKQPKYVALISSNSGMVANLVLRDCSFTLKDSSKGSWDYFEMGSLACQNSGVIVNCGVQNSTITCDSDISGYLGGFVAHNYGGATDSEGIIYNSYVTGAITVSMNSDSSTKHKICNDYSNVSVYAGGFIGVNHEGATIENCYHVGDISCSKPDENPDIVIYSGKFIPENVPADDSSVSTGTLKDCYTSPELQTLNSNVISHSHSIGEMIWSKWITKADVNKGYPIHGYNNESIYMGASVIESEFTLLKEGNGEFKATYTYLEDETDPESIKTGTIYADTTYTIINQEQFKITATPAEGSELVKVVHIQNGKETEISGIQPGAEFDYNIVVADTLKAYFKEKGIPSSSCELSGDQDYTLTYTQDAGWSYTTPGNETPVYFTDTICGSTTGSVTVIIPESEYTLVFQNCSVDSLNVKSNAGALWVDGNVVANVATGNIHMKSGSLIQAPEGKGVVTLTKPTEGGSYTAFAFAQTFETGRRLPVGTNVSFTITPEEGYELESALFGKVSMMDTFAENKVNHTITDDDTDLTVTITFKKVEVVNTPLDLTMVTDTVTVTYENNNWYYQEAEKEKVAFTGEITGKNDKVVLLAEDIPANAPVLQFAEGSSVSSLVVSGESSLQVEGSVTVGSVSGNIETGEGTNIESSVEVPLVEISTTPQLGGSYEVIAFGQPVTDQMKLPVGTPLTFEIEIEEGYELASATIGGRQLVESLSLLRTRAVSTTINRYYKITGDESDLKVEITFRKTNTDEPEDPDTPPVDPVKYYNIYEESICDGVSLSFSKNPVKEGGSISIKVEKDEENYTFENFKVWYKESYYGNWKELKESTQPGEYKIQNIWTHIYVKAEGSEKKNPTGMEEVEGVKVYTKDGSLFVQTSQREQVIIISMTGAVVKNEEQVGLKQYHGLNPGIYIVRIGNNIYKIRIK